MEFQVKVVEIRTAVKDDDRPPLPALAVVEPALSDRRIAVTGRRPIGCVTVRTGLQDDFHSRESDNGNEDHMVTFRITGNADQYERDYSGNNIGGYVIGWEDMPFASADRDYNDLVVELSGVNPVEGPAGPIPEPSSLVLMGLGLAAGGIRALRRRDA